MLDCFVLRHPCPYGSFRRVRAALYALGAMLKLP